MATIGSTLDTDKNNFYMKEIFRLLERHANNKFINSRMRFMIRDLVELRVSVRNKLDVILFVLMVYIRACRN